MCSRASWLQGDRGGVWSCDRLPAGVAAKLYSQERPLAPSQQRGRDATYSCFPREKVLQARTGNLNQHKSGTGLQGLHTRRTRHQASRVASLRDAAGASKQLWACRQHASSPRPCATWLATSTNPGLQAWPSWHVPPFGGLPPGPLTTAPVQTHMPVPGPRDGALTHAVVSESVAGRGPSPAHFASVYKAAARHLCCPTRVSAGVCASGLQLLIIDKGPSPRPKALQHPSSNFVLPDICPQPVLISAHTITLAICPSSDGPHIHLTLHFASLHRRPATTASGPTCISTPLAVFCTPVPTSANS